jgi:hypothetical protein
MDDWQEFIEPLLAPDEEKPYDVEMVNPILNAKLPPELFYRLQISILFNPDATPQ